MPKFDSSEVQVFILKEFKDPSTENEESEDSSSSDELASPKPSSAFQLSYFDRDGSVPENFSEEERSDDEKIKLSQDFKSGEFIQENTLLSNAENYSATIREGAQLYSERLTVEIEEKYAEAEKYRQEAESIKRNADEERRQMIRGAEQQVQSIKDEAYKSGFQQGRTEGINQRYDEAGPQVEQIESICEHLKSLRQIIRFQAEQELLQLAVLISKNVVLEELKVNPEVQYNILRAALKEVETLGKVRVFLHPDDYDFLEKSQVQLENYMNEEQTLILKPSVDVAPGAILIETDENVINFSFEKQFEAIETRLSQQLAERTARMNEVDMDAYDFSSPPDDAERTEST